MDANKTFSVRINNKTMGASIHSTNCSARNGRRFDFAYEATAVSALELRQTIIVEESLRSRGLPLPKICDCCR